MELFGTTRSHVARDHALICPDSFVYSPMPGWTHTHCVILIAPPMGARFTQYLANMEAGATAVPAAIGLERAVYVLEGTVTVSESGTLVKQLEAGGFAYLPAGSKFTIEASSPARLNVFEKRFTPREGVPAPKPIFLHERDVPGNPFMGDPDARLHVLMPDEPAYDMAVNVFRFQPGAALPLVEIHVMEHGLLMLEGQGIYRLGDSWYPVKAGDVIWMKSFCPQWFVAMGKTPAAYLYYKDVNRDPLGSRRMNVPINSERLTRELNELASFSSEPAPPPAVTRVLYTEPDMQARAFFKHLCKNAGLAVREDAIGNTFARWVGSSFELPAVGTGSHTDAIPHAGVYDGTVGVLGGLEAIRALKESGFQPKRSLEVLMFTSEEPTRFGIGCVGSRAMTGAITIEALAGLRDAEQRTLDDVRRSAGFSGDLSTVLLPKDYYSAFVELHIEQGPILERERLPIGIVTAIAAPASLTVEIAGEGGHAGAVLMPVRKDALCAAAEILLAVERAAKDTGSPDAVATTGVCIVHPGAINSVPSKVNLKIDIRDVNLVPRDQSVKSVRTAIDEVSRRRGVTAVVEMLNSDPPAAMAPAVVDAAEAACATLGIPFKKMVSRAYHDSLFMAHVYPTGMIFIPCRGGVSHRPDEYSSPEEIRKGVEVLALTMAELSK